MRGIHRWQVNSPHKGPVTRKMFPFDDVIMLSQAHRVTYYVPYLPEQNFCEPWTIVPGHARSFFIFTWPTYFDMFGKDVHSIHLVQDINSLEKSDNAWKHFNTLRPKQNVAIFQTTFSNAFSWMKVYEFPLRFHWSLFPRVQLTKFQRWFR